MKNKKNTTDFKALFLGSKSENFNLFKELINNSYEDAAAWRKNFHSQDREIITSSDKRTKEFIDTQSKMEEVLTNLSSLLRGGSIPWHSPRYLGHMNSETLMPGIIAYFETMFYNGNNVAYESSPATSKMESEVGIDFCKMLGYDPKKAWGHICADGSIANYEGLWYARNFKSLPFAIKKAFPNLVKGKTDWELSNMSVDDILKLLEKNEDKWDIIKSHSVRHDSENINKLGKVFVPKTKHYSWLKAADILGIGTNNVIPIDVDKNFRMDIEKLETEIQKCIDSKTPIIAVVSVVGTTEEGMFDHVDKVIAIRKKIAKQNAWFYYHIDAAYGGYTRSIFLDEDNNFIPFKDLKGKYEEYGVFQNKINWPSQDVYNSFAAMGESDSITIDPHKMGYSPYSAGGIAIRDIRMRNAISYFATYVFDTKIDIPDLLGAYMLEGSKAGATAAAVWTNHRVVPLNISGHGKLIGHSIEGAFNFYNHLVETKKYKINGTVVNVFLLTNPDFNMVDFVFNFEGNTSLIKMNELNQKIYEKTSFVEGDTYTNTILLSHTNFSDEEYGKAPLDLLNRSKIDAKDFKKEGVNILRSCILSPWLYDKDISTYFNDIFDKSIQEKLKEIIK